MSGGGLQRGLAGALAGWLLAGPGLAGVARGQAALPGLGEEAARRPVAGLPRAAPWGALARVQTELGGRCTGAVVAPRLVLTAAHCLIAPRTGRMVRPGSVHVLLGYAQGSWLAHARVGAIRLDPGFAPGGGGRAGPDGAVPEGEARDWATRDWAVLVLDAPLDPPGGPLPVASAMPAPGTPALLAGYQQDRPEVLLADEACDVRGPAPTPAGPLLAHSCAGTRGTSGAPLLVRGASGGWEVAGVATLAWRAGRGGLAVPFTAWRAALSR